MTEEKQLAERGRKILRRQHADLIVHQLKRDTSTPHEDLVEFVAGFLERAEIEGYERRAADIREALGLR